MARADGGSFLVGCVNYLPPCKLTARLPSLRSFRVQAAKAVTMDENKYRLDCDNLQTYLFLKQEYFTLKEYACLIARVDPYSLDDSVDAKEIFSSLVAPFLRLMRESEREEAGIGSHTVVDAFGEPDEVNFPITIHSFMGYQERDPTGDTEPKYPVDACLDFCRQKDIPLLEEVESEFTRQIAARQNSEPVNSTAENVKITETPSVEVSAPELTNQEVQELTHNCPIAVSVMKVIAEFFGKPEKDRNSIVLTAKLSLDAKKNGWGNGEGGGLSQAQENAINLLFFRGNAGRGSAGRLKVDLKAYQDFLNQEKN